MEEFEIAFGKAMWHCVRCENLTSEVYFFGKANGKTVEYDNGEIVTFHQHLTGPLCLDCLYSVLQENHLIIIGEEEEENEHPD